MYKLNNNYINHIIKRNHNTFTMSELHCIAYKPSLQSTSPQPLLQTQDSGAPQYPPLKHPRLHCAIKHIYTNINYKCKYFTITNHLSFICRKSCSFHRMHSISIV